MINVMLFFRELDLEGGGGGGDPGKLFSLI